MMSVAINYTFEKFHDKISQCIKPSKSNVLQMLLYTRTKCLRNIFLRIHSKLQLTKMQKIKPHLINIIDLESGDCFSQNECCPKSWKTTER